MWRRPTIPQTRHVAAWRTEMPRVKADFDLVRRETERSQKLWDTINAADAIVRAGGEDPLAAQMPKPRAREKCLRHFAELEASGHSRFEPISAAERRRLRDATAAFRQAVADAA